MSDDSNAVSRAIQSKRVKGQFAVLAEIKLRRHDGVDLLGDRDVGDLAAAYALGGASVISVVTGKWFGGSIDLLDQIAEKQLGLPILRKDFIRNKKSLHESKDRGASAVLMTRQILDAERFSDLVAYARQLGLEPFVEVADAAELSDVLTNYDGLIAINNADIATREASGEGIRRSLKLRGDDTDDERVWVSASKVNGPDDIKQLAAAGFDGALVGTHLMMADDPKVATAELVQAGCDL